jgi:PKD repeat protein
VNDGEELELAPVDLVYVCGTKFLATNSTRSTVHVTYRVEGTGETGGVTLPQGLEDEPGFSETQLETKERGVVELYRDGELVARRLNQGIACGAPAMASVAGLTSADGGSWSPPFPWPNVAVHLSLLPTGKVLSWGEFKPLQVWDPATEEFTPVPSPPINVFCAGHSFLADGRLLVSGGHLGKDRGFRDNTIFTASAGSWSRSTPMRRGRWYPTNITMGNGEVVIIAGRDELSEVVREPEVWSPSGVRVLSGAARTFPYYPRAFLAPDGRLFYAGSQLGTKYLNPSGTGRWTHGPRQLYPAARSDGAAVMYEPGKVLYVGGAQTTNTAEIIDLNSAAPAWQWTGSMAFARRHLNATLLPTGEVLVTSGTGGARYNDYLNAVHAAEVWNPSTGTWRVLASNTVNRGYHSTSILLPDGRVLHAGSGNGGGAPGEENAEIYSPPYLFKGSRPVITSAPTSVRYGTAFDVWTPQAADIAKVSLVRLGSTTHSVDMNQRFEWLSFAPKPDRLTISVPSNPNRTPPGHYMLFILDGDGVPSVAKIVKVGSTADPDPPSEPPADAAPSASFTSSCDGFGCDFTDTSTDDDGTVVGWSWDFGDGGTSTARNPNHTYAAAGSYTVTLRVTDDDDATNERSAAVTVTAPPPIALTVTGRIEDTRHIMTLRWSGATGTTVDVYRNGPFLTNTANDGVFGNSRTAQGPVTYIYKVCQAGTSVCSNEATVQVGGETPPPPPPPPPSSIALTVTGRVDGTRHIMTLRWTGATGPTVDVYRNGPFLTNTANDGVFGNSRTAQGRATYTYKVCQAGSSICSNEATVVVE